MTSEEKQQKSENFEWWITSIPDKIVELENLIDFPLDKSITSINYIESYIIKSYSERFFKSKEGLEVLDQLASYIGSTFKSLIPDLKWHLEVDDEKNIYFGKPTLISSEFPSISPFVLIFSIIRKKEKGFLRKKINNRVRPR